jgi:hypothetical protein
VIYADTSVLLAQLLADDLRPPPSLWEEPLVSSRLAEYEVWTRLHARRLARSHGEAARELLARISFLELSPIVLARALEQFPRAVRTLDALHLASLHFLRARRLNISLATYDRSMRAAAERMRFPLVPLKA